MGIPMIDPANGPFGTEPQAPRLKQYVLSAGDDNEYHLDCEPWRCDDAKTLQLPPRLKRDLIEKIRKIIAPADIQAFKRREGGIY